MNRIEEKFQELKSKRRKAFIAFITAGYPSLKDTQKLILGFDKIGVDIIELGVPFSDPLADGPLIQEASQFALGKKINLNLILKAVKNVRKATAVPLCLMTYYNPVFCFGEERFLRQAKVSGVDGLIIPDLPPEEGKTFIALANKYKIDVICFISPTTSLERIKHIGAISKGFIYYVSLTGVTGPRRDLAADLAKNIRLIKKHTAKPVCAGFGISSRLQVKQVYKISDGVIVGSAIIKKIKENLGKPDLVRRVTAFVKTLSGTLL